MFFEKITGQDSDESWSVFLSAPERQALAGLEHTSAAFNKLILERENGRDYRL